MSSNSFSLQENDIIKRSELHDQYGGNRQSGIAASAKTPISSFLLTQKKAKTTAIMIAGMRRELPYFIVVKGNVVISV